MTHKAYSASSILPASKRPDVAFFLDMDDEAPRIGSIEEGTRQARIHARETHREFASWHEAYAVIKEKLDEFWDSVKANEPDLDELLQVAACCQLAIKELGNTGGERGLR